MDCEGFQDLRLWCTPPTMDDLNTPSTDKERRFTFDVTHDTNTPISSDMSRSTSGLWDVFPDGDDACVSIGDMLCSENHLRENALLNTNHQYNSDAFDIENMPVVFNDLPKYEDSVNIASDGQVFMGATALLDGNFNPSEHIIIKDEDWDIPIEKEVNIEDVSVDETPTYAQPTLLQLSSHSHSILQQHPYSSNRANERNIDNVYLLTDNTIVIDDCEEQVEKLQYHVKTTPKKNMNILNLNNTIVIDDSAAQGEKLQYYVKTAPKKNMKNLNINIENPPRYNLNEFRNLDPVVTTPDVLMTVEQLEADRKFNLLQYVDCVPPPIKEEEDSIMESHIHEDVNEDITPPETPKFFEQPKRASKRRCTSEDSDESYVPPSHKKTHKTPRIRKPSVTKAILTTKSLLELDLPKKKGRPPKRRESMASTCTNTTDDNVSTLSTEEMRYRELRDKNNEASRRSRMTRKLQELENEKLVEDLEKRNRMLTVKAERLEKTAKLLKDVLMAAMLKR